MTNGARLTIKELRERFFLDEYIVIIISGTENVVHITVNAKDDLK